MKEYCSSEIFETPISSGVAYKGLDFGIESFAGGVGDWIHAIAEKTQEKAVMLIEALSAVVAHAIHILNQPIRGKFALKSLHPLKTQ
jgi:hypothetical protein